MRAYWIACLALVCAGCAWAQQYSFHDYAQPDGLKNLAVTSIARDRKDFLWLGTENGVYRFLGSGFVRFALGDGSPDQNVVQMYAAPDGTLWAGGNENLYAWNGREFAPVSQAPIPILHAMSMAEEAPGRMLVLDGSRLLLLRYGPDGQARTRESVLSEALLAAHPAARELTSVAIADAGSADESVWLGCQRHLCRMQHGQMVEWGKDRGVPEGWWNTLRVDPSGAVWAVSSQRVMELEPGARQFVDRSVPWVDPQTVYRQYPIAMDPQGRVLVAAGDGLARWNGAKQQWERIGPANGLRFGRVNSIVFGTSDDVWIGTAGYGLAHWIGYDNWEGWSEQQGLPSSNIWYVGPFLPDRVYVGTEKGPAWIDRQTGRVSLAFQPDDSRSAATSGGSKREGWRFGQVSGLARDDQGGLWVTTFSGKILRLDAQTGKVRKEYPLPDHIYNVVQSEGTIFFASSHGIYAVHPDKPGDTPKKLAEVTAILGNERVLLGCQSNDDGLWFATKSRLVRWRAGQWSSPQLAGLPDAKRTWDDFSCGADGSFWLTGEPIGTWQLRPEPGSDGHRYQATQLQLPEQYKDLAEYSIVVDRRGYVWIGTDEGLVVWNGQSRDASSWRHLTIESGLIWNDVNQNRMKVGPDGSIWIGTSGGLGHIVHPERIFDAAPLSIEMIAIRQDGRTLPRDGGFALPWSRRQLSFEFAAPSVWNRSSLLFEYRIPGIHMDWVETAGTTAEFPNLLPGSYRFEVRARNPDSRAQSAMLIVPFRILPPWWLTGWFFSLCGLGFVAMLLLLYRIRTRHLLRRKRQLERLVLERTLELEKSREELRIQATYDGLTGLRNRSAALTALDLEMQRCLRERTSLLVVLADIDHFKKVNDTYGHLAGDQALREFARAIENSIRAYDTVGRYGGEEFLIVLKIAPGQDIEEFLARLHGAVSNLPVRHAETSFPLTCSMGAVVLSGMDPTRMDMNRALAMADEALYRAKRAGRNRVIFEAIGGAPRVPVKSAT